MQVGEVKCTPKEDGTGLERVSVTIEGYNFEFAQKNAKLVAVFRPMSVHGQIARRAYSIAASRFKRGH